MSFVMRKYQDARTHARRWALIPALLMLEVCIFPSHFAIKYARLNAQPVVHRPPDHFDGEAVFRRLVKHQSSMSKYICIKVKHAHMH